MKIPFNIPYINSKTFNFIKKTITSKNLGNYGFQTIKAERKLSEIYNNKNIILTNSCTSALEIVSFLIGIKKHDEVIVPSYTFTSTANAFVSNGAKIIFCDINEKDLNLEVNLVEQLITKKTKAIVVTHYAGESCDILRLNKICKKKNIFLIEDAAQAFMSKYDGKYLGSIGDFGCISFHESKNIISGQGGALIIKNSKYYKKACFLRDKGTNRIDFQKSLVKKYTWVSKGSSYTMGEISATLLNSQLREKNKIINKRKKIWKRYFNNLKKYENKLFQLPKKINKNSNAHIFFLILKNKKVRDKLIEYTKKYFQLNTHYEPLHNSKAGKLFGKTTNNLNNTLNACNCLVRLPLYYSLTVQNIDYISKSIIQNLKEILNYEK